MLSNLRKKPPAGLPNINSGTPWSDLDLSDLRQCVRERHSVGEIADFLCRDHDEVAAKIAALEL